MPMKICKCGHTKNDHVGESGEGVCFHMDDGRVDCLCMEYREDASKELKELANPHTCEDLQFIAIVHFEDTFYVGRFDDEDKAKRFILEKAADANLESTEWTDLVNECQNLHAHWVAIFESRPNARAQDW
jgi:hypothetical protein